MTDAWTLHAQLAADSVAVGDFALSRLLLSNDANYPWFILVPRRAGVREIHELSDADQMQLLRESSLLGRTLMSQFKGTKLNVAALGNVVPQLHLHHIVRFSGDAAWPAPVWGRVPAAAYAPNERAHRIRQTQSLLALELAALP